MAEWQHNLATMRSLMPWPGEWARDEKVAASAHFQAQLAIAERLEAIAVQLERLVAVSKVQARMQANLASGQAEGIFGPGAGEPYAGLDEELAKI